MAGASPQKAVQTEELLSPEENVKDGEFAGKYRYEGTILVERKIGDEWQTVMTDKPRPGDRVQEHTMNLRTGELETSDKKETSPSTMPRR